MSLYCDLVDLHNESDVEQKFIFPFLTSTYPMGLGYNNAEIFSKSQLRRRPIGKAQRKVYFPDYLIFIRGLPVMVIEIKARGIDLGTAYSEARLYAEEINAQYPHGFNPCEQIFVSNADETWAGYFDQDEPIIKIQYSDFVVEHIDFEKLLSLCAKKALEQSANSPYALARGGALFHSPVSQIGGKRARDEELIENGFGRTLVIENRNIFDPETEGDRYNIVENAYIVSEKRAQHMEPFYSELKKIRLPSDFNSTPMATDRPIELVGKIKQGIIEQDETCSLLLLIGNVGSGKTTFVRYFKRMYLEKEHPDISNRCEWAFINMNLAPVNSTDIYNWIMGSIINTIKNNHVDIDFDDISIIKQIHKLHIDAFRKGIGQLLVQDSPEYNKELFSILKELNSNKLESLLGIISYIKSRVGKSPIIVLDNCDKRNREEQLLMFEVAQWLREQFKSIVILPMRDSTYDLYKNENPLDTVVKDLVFRIDAPDLLKVLQSRIEYILRSQNNSQSSYYTENGMKIIVGKGELVDYSRCILLAIRKNRWAKNVFYQLTNKNIRFGIQLFEDLCKSGHVSTNDIFKLRTVGDTYELPNYLLMNALLRKNRKYFDGEKSNFSNLFYAHPADTFPDPFVRVDILRWLDSKRHKKGPNGIPGYFKISDIVKYMQLLGHEESVITREAEYLIQRQLILSEATPQRFSLEDLIRISPAGSLHIRLLKNVSYLAACAEDVPYKDTLLMTRIAHRLSAPEHLQKILLIQNAQDMVNYLKKYQQEYLLQADTLIESDDYLAVLDMGDCQSAIDAFIGNDTGLQKQLNELDAYKEGTIVECTIVNKKGGGLLCVFADGLRAFISVLDEKYNLSNDKYDKLSVGDTVSGRVISYDYANHSFQVATT